MQITPTQKTAFGTKFIIETRVKPKNQRFHYSDMTKDELLLSKELEKVTPKDKSYKLLLSSIDFVNKKFKFNLHKYNKQVAEASIDFSNLTKPLDELNGDKLHNIFKELKTDSQGKRAAYTRRIKPDADEYQVFVNKFVGWVP